MDGLIDTLIGGVSSLFQALIDVILGLIDTLTSPFGFKFSDTFYDFLDFLKGVFEIFKSVFGFFPEPFSSLFTISIFILFAIIIYKIIRG